MNNTGRPSAKRRKKNKKIFFIAIIAFATERPKYKAISFDAFPIFDPRPIASLAEEPGVMPDASGQDLDALVKYVLPDAVNESKNINTN